MSGFNEGYAKEVSLQLHATCFLSPLSVILTQENLKWSVSTLRDSQIWCPPSFEDQGPTLPSMIKNYKI